MPDQETTRRAERDKAEGKAPTTQDGEFIREEFHHIREGKHGARSAKQAIAIGLSKARRILVVDDNRDSTDSLAVLLRLFGNDVRTAYDGRQALAIAHGYQPDLILLDLGLPGMTGFEVAKQLRTLRGLADVVIVALTGYGTDEDRSQSRAAGFNAHFIKPVDLTALQGLLANLDLLGAKGT